MLDGTVYYCWSCDAHRKADLSADPRLALAMVRPDLGEAGSELEMTILGRRHPVRVIEESPYDPENQRLRA